MWSEDESVDFEEDFRTMNRSHRRPLAQLCLAMVLLVTQGVVSGEVGDLERLEGREITRISYQGNVTLSEDTLQYYLGLEPGAKLDQKDLNSRIRQLWQTGLVEDVAVEGAIDGAGVALTIRVSERPVLRSIEYQGIKRLSRTDIEDKIGSDRIALYEGDQLRLGELKRLEESIEELYREKGYRFADASYVVEDLGGNERRVVFTIDEGNRVRIDDIGFEGNTVYGDWRLRLFMTKTKETNPVWRVAKKDLYNPAKLQEDLEAIKDAYQKLGYKDVLLGEPIIEVKALRPGRADPDDQKRRMFITIPIEEGERWKFGSVTINGNEKYTDQQLLSVFEARSGDWLRSTKIEEGVKAIDEIYRNTGYINSRIAPEIVEKPDRIADLVINVAEGDQFTVGRIEFEGNTRTRDKVLRRELRIHEGLVLSLQRVQNSLLKIKQLGYFNVNEDDPVQIVNVDDEQKTIDLIIKGQEADRTELQFGGGWSEFDGFFGQLSMRTQNFMGRGESLGVSFQSGRTRDFYDVSYFVPWFLDRPQTIGVSAFSRDTDFSVLLNDQQLRRREQGATVTYGRSYGLFNSVSMTYLRQKVEDVQTIFQAPPGGGTPVPIVVDQSFTQSALRPVYLYNSVDSPFEPTRGTKFRFQADYAGGFLGASQSFFRPEATFTLYRPITQGRVKTVLGVNAKAGWIKPFDGYDLLLLDRFYLGGESSVRGFAFRSITVRDGDVRRKDATGLFNLGGDKYLQLNLEYHFLTNSPFRFLLFADAGSVFAENQDIAFDNLQMSAGVEVRVLLPLFGAPLRFIYAQNLRPLPDDRFDSFDFTIGASF